jgi:predicted transglutaminase-like cysteine proteinase
LPKISVKGSTSTFVHLNLERAGEMQRTKSIPNILAIVASCLLLEIAVPSPAAVAAPVVDMSGRSSSLSMGGSGQLVLKASQLDRWRSVKARQHVQSRGSEWRQLLASIRGRGNLLQRVNTVVNRVRYVSDPQDRWQTPSEFLRNGGDCEDYAIAKYMLLRAVGISSSSMRIAGLAARPGLAAHAVLIVSTGHGEVVLDNQRAGVYALTNATTSRVVYAVNDTKWWISLGNNGSLAAR